MPPIFVDSVAVAGKIVVWGDDSQRQVSDTPPGKFRAVAPGGSAQSLAIDEDGSLVLWGGVGSTRPIVPALPSPSGTGVSGVAGLIRGEFVDAAIGLTHLIAVRRDGTIAHWGDYLDKNKVTFANTLRATAVSAGAVANVVVAIDGTLHKSGSIADPPKGGSFTKVRMRSDYAIALRADGRLFGWGGNLFQTLTDWTSDGDGHFYIDGPFKDLAAGPNQDNPALPKYPHVLALYEDGKVIGWGTDNFGEASKPPKDVAFQAIAAGLTYSLGLDVDGKLHHWGNHHAGTGLAPRSGFSVADVPKGHFLSVSAAGRHATAVRDKRIGIEAGPDAV